MRRAGSPTHLPRAEFARKRGLMAKSKYHQAHGLLEQIAEHAQHGLRFSRQQKRVPFSEIMRIHALAQQLDELIAIKAEAQERPARSRKASTQGAADAASL